MSRPATKAALLALRVYQKTLSPDHGWMRGFYPYGCCKFHPTCSQYAIDAIAHHGLPKGSFMATWRVLRCHPLSKGGIDPAT